ncbi:LAQU0S02e08504g1_1 [Lachancea quebecensis]|uniref:LAQU0S02e08504g1_1 n=1 Tax=Lachancea quebecensis TaxID=1654605 RepID=A0A0P1KQX2_9SACH|nr:LAQU0S02e08504g1_1 [Lachancea quebecensis]
MIRRFLHSLRGVKLPPSRMIVKLTMLLVVVAATLVLYVQSAKLGHYSKVSKYSPDAEEMAAVREGSNKHPYSFMDEALLLQPIKGSKFSPLELIPGYDADMKAKRKASWDFLARNHRFRTFAELTPKTQCYFYFQKMYQLNNAWSNNYNKWGFIINDEEEQRLASVDDATKEAVRDRKRNIDIALGMERMRVYDSCFVLDESISVSELFKSLQNSDPKLAGFDQWDFERRMWPIIRPFNKDTFVDIMPTLVSPQGVTIEKGYLPPLDDTPDYITKAAKYEYNEKLSLMANWNKMSSIVSKRGLVLGFGDGQVKMASKFIAQLRFTGNLLPIQVVHKGDLSRESIDALLKVAQSDKLTFPETDYQNGKNVKQELWFVNMGPALDTDVRDSFSGFKNKWLAQSFNLFEEYIFMDVDAISYVDLDYYFQTPGYRETGTLFFRDRYQGEGVDTKCPAMVETLFPNFLENYYWNHYAAVDLDYLEYQCDKYLRPHEKAVKNYFVDNNKHQMDSGLVVAHKNSHIVPLMLSSMLHMTQALGPCSYGDKEYFWLGFYASGHEFAFHEGRPGATGTIKDDEHVNQYFQQKKHEICSAIISHMSEHSRELLWVNGGAQTCKFDDAAESDWKNEKLNMPSKFSSLEEIQRVYHEPVDIQYGILPAEKVDGWGRTDGRCKGYVFCARYERHIKPYSFSKLHEKGTLIEFSPQKRTKYNAINAVWVADYLSQDL